MWNLLRYTFFQNALLGSLFASIACAIIGTYIVSRRLVFISGGITHASFGGIGIGIYAGISPIFCAAVYSVLSALGIEWFSRRSDVREDSAIAVFWTFGMSIGIIFTFLTKSYVPDISSYLFGNILAVTHVDLIFILCMALVLVIFFSLYMRSVISISFDRDFAMSNGIPVALLEYVLMALIALTVVSCLRMIGIVLGHFVVDDTADDGKHLHKKFRTHHLAFNADRIHGMRGRTVFVILPECAVGGMYYILFHTYLCNM